MIIHQYSPSRVNNDNGNSICCNNNFKNINSLIIIISINIIIIISISFVVVGIVVVVVVVVTEIIAVVYTVLLNYINDLCWYVI